MAKGFKKIEVIESNNIGTCVYQCAGHVFPLPDKKYLQSLKKFVESKGFLAKKGKELSLIRNALKWSTSQWQHNGMNEPPKGARALDILKNVFTNKAQYRCVEYGIVLAELLQSYGFITRTVSLRLNEAAYGGPGQGHVAMEVWSNSLNKWIFLDPQFGTYLSFDDSILNVHEIYELKKRKKWQSIKVESPKRLSKKEQLDYKKFLVNYFGLMYVSDKKGAVTALFLETKLPVFTFQGMAFPSAVVFTDNRNEVYPQINKVAVLLDFKAKAKSAKEQAKLFRNLRKKLSIKTNEDYFNNRHAFNEGYLNSMHAFAPEPKFAVELKNNMPMFSFYEYRTSRKNNWKKISKSTFNWSAENKTNLLEVRAVNDFDRRGPITFIKLRYN